MDKETRIWVVAKGTCTQSSDPTGNHFTGKTLFATPIMLLGFENYTSLTQKLCEWRWGIFSCVSSNFPRCVSDYCRLSICLATDREAKPRQDIGSLFKCLTLKLAKRVFDHWNILVNLPARQIKVAFNDMHPETMTGKCHGCFCSCMQIWSKHHSCL